MSRKPLLIAFAAASLGIAGVSPFALADRPSTDIAAERAEDYTCPHASDAVRKVSRKALRKSVLCLLNAERRRHARKPLARSKALQSAAQKHVRVMVATDCLAHKCPHEPDLETRVRRSGYLRGARAWRFAENTGCGRTSEAMVANWMASRFHRINIVDKDFRDIGVGVDAARVKRRCDRGFGTFAIVLGYRGR